MTVDDFLWVGIGADAWLLVDGPDLPTSGVVRAYVLGIWDDDWLWKTPGHEGRAASMEEASLGVLLSLGIAGRVGDG